MRPSRQFQGGAAKAYERGASVILSSNIHPMVEQLILMRLTRSEQYEPDSNT